MQNFIIALLICSVTMSALALIYMAVTPLLAKRYSIKWRYYTWLIVIIGLIIPLRPQWSTAIINIDIPGETAAAVMQTESQLGNQMPNHIGAQAGTQIGAQLGDSMGGGAAVTAPLSIENTAFTAVLANISWWQVAAIVWLAGAIVFLAYHVIRHYRFAKMINRWSESITDERPIDLLQDLKTEMGIAKAIEIYQCSSIGSPMMIGFVNPRVLLPKIDLDQDELYFILKHELVHYKRKDLYYKCLVLLATAIHWFNPIIYLVGRAIEVQCELSCDAETVRSANEVTRQHYSETIIGLVRYRSTPKTVLSTNFYGGRNGMRKRIFSIMDMSNKKAGAAIFCLALAATLATGLAASSNSNALPSLTNDSSAATAGSIIQFGGIDWRVLEVKDGKALVISDEILFKGKYHSTQNAVTWEECDLRQYLNGQFYAAAFSAEEQARIVETTLSNADNPWYGTAGGNNTTDKVFLLSTEETLQYFGDSGALENRQGSITFISDQFDEARMAKTENGDAAWWWSRSSGIYYSSCDNTSHACAVAISVTGSLGIQGNYVDDDGGGVRPALWLNL